jgi:hypothetical protein
MQADTAVISVLLTEDCSFAEFSGLATILTPEPGNRKYRLQLLQ